MNKHLTEHNEFVYMVLRACECLNTCILRKNLMKKKVIAFNEKNSYYYVLSFFESGEK